MTQLAFAPPCLLKRLPTPLCALLGSRPGLMIADREQRRALGGSRPRETEATLTRLHDADVKDRTPGGNGSPSLPPTLKQQAVWLPLASTDKPREEMKCPGLRREPVGLWGFSLQILVRTPLRGKEGNRGSFGKASPLVTSFHTPVPYTFVCCQSLLEAMF